MGFIPPNGELPVLLMIIAFYLPQFHPIPENDVWWGKGFTEWTNVAKAKPLFRGHYQPRLPADLGFYDLRCPETQEAQAQLAREHGISGFCYYHYWFHGKRLLHRPLDQLLASGKPDFPFCLCWANENWTRRWDGMESEILVEQTYSREDDVHHIQWLTEIFADPRYIRIDNKPLFLVYRASKLPDSCGTIKHWREHARRCGVGELFLCKVDSFPGEEVSPGCMGFDAMIEFQPRWWDQGPALGRRRGYSRLARLGLIPRVYGENFVYEYENLVSRALNRVLPDYPFFRCVTPSWDNSARRRKGALIAKNSTPQMYANWLGAVLNQTKSCDSSQPIFINAWNEWAEGNHLEPDLRFGRSYLEATRSTVLSVSGESASQGSEANSHR